MGPFEMDEKSELLKLLEKFPEVITDKTEYTTTVKYTIICSDYTPIKLQLYPMNPDKQVYNPEDTGDGELRTY